MTTSHLTKLHKPQQVIGYSHSTRRVINTLSKSLVMEKRPVEEKN